MLQSEFLVHLYYSSTALVLKYTIHIFHSSTALLLKYSSITHLWGQGEAMEARFPGFLPFLPLFTPLLPAPSHCYGTYQPHIQLLPIHLTATKHLLTQRPYILQCKVQCCSLFITLFSEQCSMLQCNVKPNTVVFMESPILEHRSPYSIWSAPKSP